MLADEDFAHISITNLNSTSVPDVPDNHRRVTVSIPDATAAPAPTPVHNLITFGRDSKPRAHVTFHCSGVGDRLLLDDFISAFDQYVNWTDGPTSRERYCRDQLNEASEARNEWIRTPTQPCPGHGRNREYGRHHG